VIKVDPSLQQTLVGPAPERSDRPFLVLKAHEFDAWLARDESYGVFMLDKNRGVTA
jgi:hypothetical protein